MTVIIIKRTSVKPNLLNLFLFSVKPENLRRFALHCNGAADGIKIFLPKDLGHISACIFTNLGMYIFN